MDIAVIGAGIAGLTAGVRLRQADHRVMMFELNYKPGGRMNSRRKAGLVVDHGECFFMRDEPIFADLVRDCGLQGEVRTIELPIYHLNEDGSFRESPEEAVDSRRATFPDGLLVLPEALRRQLGGYYSIPVQRVEWNADRRAFQLHTDPPLRENETQFDAVVVATPAQTAVRITEPIHSMLHAPFLDAARQVHYTSCFTLMAALKKIRKTPAFYGAVPPQGGDSILHWIAFEDVKCRGRGVAGWSSLVCHATPQASESLLELPDDEALGRMYAEARRWVPEIPEQWRWARAKRWQIAHLANADMVVDAERYPAAPDDVLAEFCGDYRAGDSVVMAARTGREAAERLLGKIEKAGGGRSEETD